MTLKIPLDKRSSLCSFRNSSVDTVKRKHLFNTDKHLDQRLHTTEPLISNFQISSGTVKMFFMFFTALRSSHGQTHRPTVGTDTTWTFFATFVTHVVRQRGIFLVTSYVSVHESLHRAAETAHGKASAPVGTNPHRHT